MDGVFFHKDVLTGRTNFYKKVVFKFFFSVIMSSDSSCEDENECFREAIDPTFLTESLYNNSKFKISTKFIVQHYICILQKIRLRFNVLKNINITQNVK